MQLVVVWMPSWPASLVLSVRAPLWLQHYQLTKLISRWEVCGNSNGWIAQGSTQLLK